MMLSRKTAYFVLLISSVLWDFYQWSGLITIVHATRAENAHHHHLEGNNKTAAASYDNPTSIIPPYDGPDPGYIIAESGKSIIIMMVYIFFWQK